MFKLTQRNRSEHWVWNRKWKTVTGVGTGTGTDGILCGGWHSTFTFQLKCCFGLCLKAPVWNWKWKVELQLELKTDNRQQTTDNWWLKGKQKKKQKQKSELVLPTFFRNHPSGRRVFSGASPTTSSATEFFIRECIDASCVTSHIFFFNVDPTRSFSDFDVCLILCFPFCMCFKCQPLFMNILLHSVHSCTFFLPAVFFCCINGSSSSCWAHSESVEHLE